MYISVTEHPGCFYVSSVDAVSEKLSVEIRERYKVSEQLYEVSLKLRSSSKSTFGTFKTQSSVNNLKKVIL